MAASNDRTVVMSGDDVKQVQVTPSEAPSSLRMVGPAPGLITFSPKVSTGSVLISGGSSGSVQIRDLNLQGPFDFNGANDGHR